MKKIIFTIVAQNYIGLAETLAKSVKDVNGEIDFYVFIADEPSVPIDYRKDLNYLVAKNYLEISEDRWQNISFKYNLTEFCTAIKPACFKYLLNQCNDGAKIIYLDPDILVFNSLESIFDDLDENFLILTPHYGTMELNYTGEAFETDFLGSGVYNLGFLAIRKSPQSTSVIDWWHLRLMDNCFIEKLDYQFTDQKWMNYLTCFFSSGVLISRDLGRNMAPWNFHERKVIIENNLFFVTNRIITSAKTPLLFVHFSGFDFNNLSLKNNKNIPHSQFEKYTDLSPVFEYYQEKLVESNHSKYLSLKYSYNNFNNQDPIIGFHRRIYRRLTESNVIENPFDSNNIFHRNLKNNRLLVSVDDAKIDGSNEKAVTNFSSKLRKINRAFLLIKKLLGFKRYYLLSLFFMRYFRSENQTFLYDKKFLETSFRKNAVTKV